jgi:hypothetical protein
MAFARVGRTSLALCELRSPNGIIPLLPTLGKELVFVHGITAVWEIRT